MRRQSWALWVTWKAMAAWAGPAPRAKTMAPMPAARPVPRRARRERSVTGGLLVRTALVTWGRRRRMQSGAGEPARRDDRPRRDAGGGARRGLDRDGEGGAFADVPGHRHRHVHLVGRDG